MIDAIVWALIGGLVTVGFLIVALAISLGIMLAAKAIEDVWKRKM